MLRFLSKHRIKVFAGITALLLLVLLGGLVVYINSDGFREQARLYIVRTLEERTGGQVVLDRFTWNLWQQRFRLEGLTIRGLEPATDPPLAHIESIDVGLNFRSLIRRRLDLFLLTITRPEFRVLIDSEGKTNLPTPAQGVGGGDFNLQLSIDDFKIIQGQAAINERRINIDFGIANLESALNYSDATQVLKSQLQYQGSLARSDSPTIPYNLTADLSYTRGTILAERVEVQSGGSLVKLQGRINDVLTSNILGRLEYTGTLEVPFLNYFFVDDTFAGTADVAGLLEFSRGYFFTRGTTVADRVAFEGWQAANVRSEYTYQYPDRRLALRELRAQIVGGSASGSVMVESLPGQSRVLFDLAYQNVDAAAIARAYPWDPKYRIYSRMNGTLDGWFEGKFDRFRFTGGANLTAYAPTPTPGVVALPLEGSTMYDVQPGQVTVSNADVRFFSTSIRADGSIDARATDLRVMMTSSDLRNVFFLYEDANGAGSFDGTLTGPIKTPTAEGQFVLEGHRYGTGIIQHAAGGVRLDTLNEVADLRNVNVTQGRSEITLNGTTTLDGRRVDLQLATSRLLGEDLTPFVNRKLGGVFSGTTDITSIEPLNLEGDVRVDNLVFEDRLIAESARAHIRYKEPVAELENLSVTRRGATLAGSVAYNLRSEEIKFEVRTAALDFDSLRETGLPEAVDGVIQEAQLTGDGNRNQPNIRGEAVVRNLTVFGETFPQARIQVRSTGPNVNLVLDAASNLNLTAQINAAGNGFPFTARASFTDYSIERLIGFEQGTVTLTGRADLAGTITDRSGLRGNGQIQSAAALIQGQQVTSNRPFTFEFDSNRVTLSGVSLTGAGTAVNLAGTIGFTESAPLNLNVTGLVDLGLLAAADPEWISSGSVNVDGRVSGTVRNPDLRGLASFTGASLGRRGIFTSLSSLNGDLFFNGNRVTLNNLQGQVGGGAVLIQGTALIEGAKLDSMNIRIETNDVRIRYPEGLRTVVDGTLILRGNWDAPLLEGNLEIQNMAYRGEFEQFLQILQTDGLEDASSPLSRLALSIHIEGGRNISIQNQLADVEARVDLDINGTVARPGLTGHVEANGGTLSFQGTRYQITRGNIDFVNPLRVEPIVDIQAESDLRDYRVILAVSGRGDRLRLDVRSDPPLPQLEIVSLIAGGKTGEELATAAGRPTSEQLFQGGAASILFDLLKQRVGTRFGLIGLDRVRIDPFLVDAANNTAARVTIPLQVTKDLSITYSQDISTSQQQIIQIEYFISKNTSIVATRDELGSLALDIKHRTRF